MKTQVENITSSNGKAVPNQFNLITESGRYFQSYQSIIVFIDKSGTVFLDCNKWDYSKTTGKYRNQFLNETKKETEKKIKSGEYKLVNLNN